MNFPHCFRSLFRNAVRRFFLITGLTLALLPTRFDGLAAKDATPADTTDYIWPTNASRNLSSSFGESRDGHYHFGIDIKTNGGEGYPCFAVADGYVSRVRVSPYGYGKALYVQLDDGRTAVYAHLQRFASKVEQRVRQQQYRDQQFRCQLFFQPGEIPVGRGETIAFTGSTGIGYPHLHFEIREGDGYRNAMRYGFTVQDSWAPSPKKVAFLPLTAEAEVEGGFEPMVYSLQEDRERGVNHFTVAGIPVLYDSVGLAIMANDHTDGAPNRISVYGLDLLIDESLRFSVRFDEFRYEETKLIEIERSYRLKKRGEGVFHHLFQPRFMTAEIYHAGDGLICAENLSPGRHTYEIRLLDFNGNTSYVHGEFISSFDPVYPVISKLTGYTGFIGYRENPEDSVAVDAPARELKAVFYDDYAVLQLSGKAAFEGVNFFLHQPYESRIPAMQRGDKWIGRILLDPFPDDVWRVEAQATLEDGRIVTDTLEWRMQPVLTRGSAVLSDDKHFYADFVAGSVYQTLYVRITGEEPPKGKEYVSRVYHLHPFDVPLKGDVQVSIAIPEDEEHPEQLGLYILDKKGKWQMVDVDLETMPGSVSGATPSLESYVLKRDDEAPKLRWLAPKLTTTDRQPMVKIQAVDELSGVDDRTLSVEIDGEWLLMEYDYEKDRLTGRPEAPLTPGDHQVTVRVSDYNGNEATLERTLHIQTP